MTQHVNAIYEHGVLKPLVPLDLSEQEVVSISIEKILTNGAATDPIKSVDVPASSMIGLLADDPELADQILESAMTARETGSFRASSE